MISPERYGFINFMAGEGACQRDVAGECLRLEKFEWLEADLAWVEAGILCHLFVTIFFEIYQVEVENSSLVGFLGNSGQ